MVDEILDYSRGNIEHCRQHPDAPPLRYLPPGYARTAWAVPTSDTRLDAGSNAGIRLDGSSDATHPGDRSPRALFLGDPTLEERARCFERLRSLVRPVNHIWNMSAFRALCAHGVTLFVNLHKRCAQDERAQAFESVRAAQVLGAGGLMISQRSHPDDELAYAGLVRCWADLDGVGLG